MTKKITGRDIAKAIGKSAGAVSYKKKHNIGEYSLLKMGLIVKRFLDENNNNVLAVDLSDTKNMLDDLVAINS